MQLLVKFTDTESVFPAGFSSVEATRFNSRFRETSATFSTKFVDGESTYFNANFTKTEAEFSTDFGNVEVVTKMEGDIEPYDGEYLVTPLPEENVVLNTNRKYLTDNVTVEKIPYFEVSNTSGGTTICIGN